MQNNITVYSSIVSFQFCLIQSFIKWLLFSSWKLYLFRVNISRGLTIIRQNKEKTEVPVLWITRLSRYTYNAQKLILYKRLCDGYHLWDGCTIVSYFLDMFRVSRAIKGNIEFHFWESNFSIDFSKIKDITFSFAALEIRSWRKFSNLLGFKILDSRVKFNASIWN